MDLATEQYVQNIRDRDRSLFDLTFITYDLSDITVENENFLDMCRGEKWRK